MIADTALLFRLFWTNQFLRRLDEFNRHIYLLVLWSELTKVEVSEGFAKYISYLLWLHLSNLVAIPLYTVDFWNY